MAEVQVAFLTLGGGKEEKNATFFSETLLNNIRLQLGSVEFLFDMSLFVSVILCVDMRALT